MGELRRAADWWDAFCRHLLGRTNRHRRCDLIDPLYGVSGASLTADSLDLYRTARTADLEAYIGLLWIEWGAGARTWIQRPDRQNKPIVELTRVFREDAFPGYTHFVTNVSEIQGPPAGWVSGPPALPAASTC